MLLQAQRAAGQPVHPGIQHGSRWRRFLFFFKQKGAWRPDAMKKMQRTSSTLLTTRIPSTALFPTSIETVAYPPQFLETKAYLLAGIAKSFEKLRGKKI